MQETRVCSLGQEDLLEKGTATHSSILAWRIPWTEEPGRLQSMGLQRVRQDWMTNTMFSFVRNCQPVFQTAIHFHSHQQRVRVTVAPPAFVASVVDLGHFSACIVESHCVFNLHFPDDMWYFLQKLTLSRLEIQSKKLPASSKPCGSVFHLRNFVFQE